MSRVIVFSRYFPGYNLLNGEPTYFVEKILNQDPILKMMYKDGWKDEGYKEYLLYLNERKIMEGELTYQTVIDFYRSLNKDITDCKLHTIRGAHRWKTGDKFSPRVWSGKPRRSPQIIFAPDIDVKKTWDFTVKKYVDVWYTHFGNYSIPDNVPLKCSMLQTVARNDGLSIDDFLDWFKFPQLFRGQIICWYENVNY